MFLSLFSCLQPAALAPKDAMNLLRAMYRRIFAELCLQRLGRRSLREVRFSKYKVAPRDGDRIVAERLLRRLPGSLETSLFHLTTIR